MNRAEKRRLHRLLNPRIPSSLLLLRLMAAEGAITARRGMEHLNCELQSARNALCKLVRQGHAKVETTACRSICATYGLTLAGRVMLDESDEKLALDLADDPERERIAMSARAQANVERARHCVPRSVFDLGRCIAHPAPARATEGALS